MEQIYDTTSNQQKTPPMPDLPQLSEEERIRLQFEEVAKLLRRPQLTIACKNYGAEIRQIPNQLKSVG